MRKERKVICETLANTQRTRYFTFCVHTMRAVPHPCTEVTVSGRTRRYIERHDQFGAFYSSNLIFGWLPKGSKEACAVCGRCAQCAEMVYRAREFLSETHADAEVI